MKLLIITQKIDKEDPILGFFCSWVNEFAKYFEEVNVICLEKGNYINPSNVNVFSLGKEKDVSKFSYIKNLIYFLRKLNRRYDKVFVHMNPEYIVLCGLWWKMTNKDIFLWYTHRNVDLKLKIASIFSKYIFTSSAESMRVKTKKAVSLGHGINIEKFVFKYKKYESNQELNIAYIGRISRIKNIGILLDLVSLLEVKNIKSKIHVIGDCIMTDDYIYKQELLNIIKNKNFSDKIIFNGWIKPDEIISKLENIDISINLSPTGGMDKTVLESILLGIPTFFSNKAFSSVFGEYSNVFLFDYKNSNSLTERIEGYISNNKSEEILNTLNVKVRRDFDVKNLIRKIVEYIQL